MRKLLSATIVLLLIVISVGCTDAQVASRNLSKAADQFEINRRVVFFNGITDSYLELKPWSTFQDGGWFSGVDAEEVIMGYEAA